MKRERILKATERELEAGGFATVLASNMHTCADVIAARGPHKFIIKVTRNIDSVTRREADALGKLAGFLDAEPIIVGSVAGNQKLKENVSRYRFDVRCVSPGTLPALMRGEARLLASKAFGVKAPIDSTRLRKLRKINNMRVSDLAKKTGLSESTLYKHEEGPKYAAINTVLRIERVLKGRVLTDSDEPRDVAVRSLSAQFAKTGMMALKLNIAPFDILAKNKNYFEISLDANFRTLAKRATFFSAIRETFDSNYPFFMSDKKTGKAFGIPVVNKKALSKASSEEELLDLVYY